MTRSSEKQRIENYAEKKLYDKDYPTRGVIFSLSNNSEGWAEKNETKVNVANDGAAALAALIVADESSSS